MSRALKKFLTSNKCSGIIYFRTKVLLFYFEWEVLMLEHLKMGINLISKPEQTQPGQSSVTTNNSRSRSGRFTITLRQLVNEIGPLPPNSIVIGGCEDGMHFFLALDDPRPGSILVIGDRGSGKHRLVRSILASAVLLNPPRRLRYALISGNLSRFNGFSSKAHCYAAFEPGTQACELIHELTDLFARRWAGQGTGSPILLLVEDLPQVALVWTPRSMT
jgi:hypothetical protein